MAVNITTHVLIMTLKQLLTDSKLELSSRHSDDQEPESTQQYAIAFKLAKSAGRLDLLSREMLNIFGDSYE